MSDTEEYFKIMPPAGLTIITQEEYDSLTAQYNGSDFHWKEPGQIDFTIENIEDVFDVNIANRYDDWVITSR